MKDEAAASRARIQADEPESAADVLKSESAFGGASPEERAVFDDAIRQAADALEDPDEIIDVDKIMDEVERRNEEIVAKRRVPVALRVVGALSFVVGLLTCAVAAFAAFGFVTTFQSGDYASMTATTIAVGVVMALSILGIVVLTTVFGLRLLLDKRRGAAQVSRIVALLMAVAIVCDIMLFGIGRDFVFFLVMVALQLGLTSYLDPSLSRERRLARQLNKMRTREQAEDGTLGLDETGRGFIALDFFNLFWIFVVASMIGLLIEVVYHMAVVDPGVYQDRAGMLFGPFSPIYGFGAVLMTLALNRFHKANVVIVFLVSAVIGGAFEFFVSWFMETAFGAKAWDYTGTFLSIGGRTNGQFMAMWGCLGVVWIKLILPILLTAVNKIPWKARYAVTTACAALMIANGVMTLQALDCWYERLSGKAPESPIDEFYAENFGNAWMEARFQSMSITPGDSSRADG